MAGLRRAVARLREHTGDFYNSIRSDFAPLPSLDIHTFGSPDDMSKFQITTDRVLGGRTDCTFSLKPYAHFTAGCFTGIVDYTDDNPESKGGFASFRTKPDERERDLSAFSALEIRVKSDGRRYVANVKSGTHGPEHLWQMSVITEPYTWVTVAVPFNQLILTRRGRVDIAQSPINKERINGFGILLADGHNGPFKFEIQWVKAIRDFDPRKYEVVPGFQLERAAEERAGIAEQKYLAARTGALPASSTEAGSSAGADGGIVAITAEQRAKDEADRGRQKLLEFYKKQKEAAKAG